MPYTHFRMIGYQVPTAAPGDRATAAARDLGVGRRRRTCGHRHDPGARDAP